MNYSNGKVCFSPTLSSADCSQCLITDNSYFDAFTVADRFEKIQTCVEKLDKNWDCIRQNQTQFVSWRNEILELIKSGQNCVDDMINRSNRKMPNNNDKSDESSGIEEKPKRSKSSSALVMRRISGVLRKERIQSKSVDSSGDTSKHAASPSNGGGIRWRGFRSRVLKRKMEEKFEADDPKVVVPAVTDDEYEMLSESDRSKSFPSQNTRWKKENLSHVVGSAVVIESEVKDVNKKSKYSFFGFDNEMSSIGNKSEKISEKIENVAEEDKENRPPTHYQQYIKMIRSDKLDNEKFYNKHYVSPLRYYDVGYVRSLAEKYSTM